MIFDVVTSGPKGTLPIITGYIERKDMIERVSVIQMGTIYFWALIADEETISSSKLMGERSLVIAQAELISEQLGLNGTIWIEERQ